MSTEKTRGTMLISTALILCCAAFGAGFLCGDLAAEYRRPSVAAAPALAPQAAAPHSEADHAADSAKHIAELRARAMKEPDNVELWTHLGNLCYDSGDHDGAIAAYRRSLELAPGNADVMTDMGSMYRMKGQPLEALKVYEQAIALKPGHSNAVFNKGVTLMLDMERPEEAVAFWKSVTEAHPALALGNGVQLKAVMHEIAMDAAMQLEAHGRTETALRAYGEALKLAPAFLPAILHHAALLDKLGRSAEAQTLWKRALELSPDAVAPSGQPVRSLIR